MSDFETTVDENGARVWAWLLMDLESEETISRGNSIDSWYESVISLASNRNVDIYFHNLKFDGTFIIDYILRNNLLEQIKEGEQLRENCFSTLISDANVWYSIKICTKVHKNRKVVVNIIDSLKKLPFSAKVIGDKWLDGNVTKGEIDYEALRPIGYEPNDVEWDYINRDCKIICKALKILQSEGNSKLTAASDALYQFRQSVGPKVEREIFPNLSVEVSDYMRPAYKGGYVYVKPAFKEKILENGEVYDVNSMYPYVMYSYPMPYDKPIEFEGRYVTNKRFPLYIQTLICKFKIKENHLPTFNIRNATFYETSEYLEESLGYMTITLSSVDLELLFDHYDVHVLKWVGGYMFKSHVGFFCEYIDKWMDIKKNETGAKRELAKLMLNSLYGKYGSNPHKKNSVPKWDYEKNQVRYSDIVKSESTHSVYLPVAIFITAWARNHIIREAQKHYDDFIYCDTDSIHLLTSGKPVDFYIHDTELGAFKLEHSFSRALYKRPKRYMYEIAGRWVVKCAGLPAASRSGKGPEIFEKGYELDKLRARKVAGGTELYMSKFTMK